MAKTKEEIEAAVTEIAEVCRKHGIFLVGIESTTGMSGSIRIMNHGEMLCLMDTDIALEDVDMEVFQSEDGFRVDNIG